MKNTEKKEIIEKINVKIFMYRAVIDSYRECNRKLDKTTKHNYIDGLDQGWGRAAEHTLKTLVNELVEIRLMIENL